MSDLEPLFSSVNKVTECEESFKFIDEVEYG